MKYLVPIFIFCLCGSVKGQSAVTVPWSATVNEYFPSVNYRLPPSKTDFVYAPDQLPTPGHYCIIASGNDAGHIFMGYSELDNNHDGFKMIARYNPSFALRCVYRDTVRNICSNTRYMFWAAVNNVMPDNCLQPDFSLQVESLTGQVIASFQTGKIGGDFSVDNFAWYFGFYDRTRRPATPFYGGSFILPAGITDVVVKIIANPSTANNQCSAVFEIDNILLMPIGPRIDISSVKYPGGWITGSCYKGNVPLELSSGIEAGYLELGTTNYVLQQYTQPGYQWQQSLDEGYTWDDVPGETQSTISHIFANPDTFWMRLRVSEINDIANQRCSNVSNILKIEVDGEPAGLTFTTNSPVCTDGDLQLVVEGGATYNTYGPNGFSDNSAKPHIYHPQLSDSGWYYSEMSTFGGCVIVDSAFVRIIGPDLDTALLADRSICYGDTVHLHSADNGTSYQWLPTEGLSGSKIQNPVASPTHSTTYAVTVTDRNGCSVTGDVTVQLRNTILKAALEAPAVACPGDIVYFKDSSEGAVTSWQWNFGNGNTSNLRYPPPQQYPVTNGSQYPVSLIIKDTAGCVQHINSVIRSVNNCYIAVPSAFSPDNDGLNDYLYPLNAYKATQLNFKVYNRKGVLLFRTSNWQDKWDGTFRGEPQSPGTYVWVLDYRDEYNKPVFLKGSVVLIR